MTRPQILVTGVPLRDVTAEALDALREANDPPEIFVRGGRLCRVCRDERGRPVIEPLKESTLCHRLARVADFLKVASADEGVGTYINPPRGVVADVLACPTWPGFPTLEAVTEVPILRPDGTIFCTPGYDPATRLIYQPDPQRQVPRIPEEPTQGDLENALATIHDLLEDFPFTNAASKANMIALLLGPILRPLIDGVVPLALVDKTKRGTGATLLVQLVQLVATGTTTDLMTAPHDEDEWRKKITAALRSGTTIMFFDNVEQLLSSAQLSAALSAPEWKDRVLGLSEMVTAPNRATWMATGNNLRVGGDIGRRSYWIRLDAGMARPWERTGFRHPDLIAYVREHRCEILAALLVLARWWFARGKPPSTQTTLGGFMPWATIVGGVLAAAGVGGFLDNQQELYDQVDDDEPAWETFLQAWHARFSDRPVPVASVVRAIHESNSSLATALPQDLADALTAEKAGKGSFSKRLGHTLRRNNGTMFGVLRLDRLRDKDPATNTAQWRVRPVAIDAQPGSPGSPGSLQSNGRSHAKFTVLAAGEEPVKPGEPGNPAALPDLS